MNDSLGWLKEFESRAGRPLRVLHIGNIANNAYNNAKIQRAAGIDADVLSFDYYHIMACPEWEDADFTGDVGDDMFPDWWAVDLHGFERPRWFAQGPLDACIRHLLAHSGRSKHRDFWWRMLKAERWLLCRRTWLAECVQAAIKVLTGARVANVTNPFNAAAGRWLAARLREAVENPLVILFFLDGLLAGTAARLARLARVADIERDQARHARAREKRGRTLLPRAQELLEPLGKRLADGDLDRLFLWWWHPYLRLLLSRYDVIQAYATYASIPMIGGRDDFVAYEHGTIRAIPFADDTQGRLCAMSYRAAMAVLVTNSDNIQAAERLKLDPAKLVFLPHAFDSGKLLRFATGHRPQHCAPARGCTSFFSPARQDWVCHDPSLSKGNDRVIRALAQVLASGHACRLQFIEWGRDVDASRKLIAELGLAAHVTWLPKMQKRELWARYLDADCVIDQFVVAAMGGVTFEAMMLGRRVISAIDEPQARRFFGEPPPLFKASSVDEIAAAMVAVIADPDDCSDRGALNQEWMRKYHSQERIVDLQVDLYRRMLQPVPGGECAVRDVRTLAERRGSTACPSPRQPRERSLSRAGRAAGRALLALGSRLARAGIALILFPPRFVRRAARALRALIYGLAPLVLVHFPRTRTVLRAALLWPRRLAASWNLAWRRVGQWLAFLGALVRYRRAWRPRPAPGSLSGLPRAVVMLVVSDLRIDPRVERAARALAGEGYAVTVIWPEPKPPFHADQPIDWGPGIRFRPLPPEAGEFVSDFPWVFEQQMLDAARRERAFVYHCHDLTTAMIGLAAARENGAYCICDFHEWYSENVSWDAAINGWKAHPAFKRRFYRAVERLVMSRADAVITVCDSIARELSETLSAERRQVNVIRNIPSLVNSGAAYPPLRKALNLRDEQFLLLWQGGTGPSRMIEPIIQALAYSPRTVFVIRGPSLDVFGEGYRAVARSAGAEDRLILLPPVPSADVVNAARGADAGIWTLPNLSKNFYYALPNKIFEYLASGLPVLAANFPEARKMVEGNGVGLCFDPYDPRSIAAQINRMADDPALLRGFREAIGGVLQKIDAGKEWAKLPAIYEALGAPLTR